MSYTAFMTAAVSEKLLLVEVDIGEDATFINAEPGLWQITRNVYKPNNSFGFGSGAFAFGGFGSGGVADLGSDIARLRIGSVFAGTTLMTRTTTLASVRSTDSSFFFDTETTILYVHFPNADPQDTIDPKQIGVVNGYSNKAAYYDDVLYDGRVLSVPNFSRKKDPLFFGKISFVGGNISLINTDGEFDDFGEDENVYGAPARVLLGFDDNDYDDFKTLYEGQIQNFVINEDTWGLQVIDKRKQLSRALPTNVFDTTTYPNLKPSNAGKPIPLAYGTILNAPVVNTNEEEATDTFTFKLVDVSDHPFGINSIDTIYTENTSNTIVTVSPSSTDLAAGEFVLTAGVYTTGNTVTVDFKGFIDSGSALVQNGLDIMKDLITTYFPISFDGNFFNTTDWNTAQAAAATVGVFINQAKPAIDIIEDLSFSVGGNFIVKDNGLFSYVIFDPDRVANIRQFRGTASSETVTDERLIYHVTSGGTSNVWTGARFTVPTYGTAVVFTTYPYSLTDDYDQNIEKFELLEQQILGLDYDTTEVLTSVRVGYNKDWNENSYTEFVYTADETEVFNKFRVYRERTFNTLLTNATDAEAYAVNIMAISGDVRNIIRVKTKMQTIDREISDIVTVDYGKDNRAFAGENNYEVLGKALNLDDMTTTLTLRKL